MIDPIKLDPHHSEYNCICSLTAKLNEVIDVVNEQEKRLVVLEHQKPCDNPDCPGRNPKSPTDREEKS